MSVFISYKDTAKLYVQFFTPRQKAWARGKLGRVNSRQDFWDRY